MHLSLTDFCEILKGLGKTNAEKAIAALWFHDYSQPGVTMSAGQLTNILEDHHVGTPNATHLGASIRKTKLVRETKAGFSLKPGSRKVIRQWLPNDIDGIQPSIDHSEGYIPEAIWVGTRGYIESVCKQLNGCFQAAYYDAALVMLRRLFETLIIEAYEYLHRQKEIQDNSGNYLMFGALVDRSIAKQQPHAGLNLGRNTKNALEAVKALGDRSAHDRRFNACAADLSKIQIDVRSAAQDLTQIAPLRRS